MAFVAGWLVPGAGHLLVGQIRKAAIFFVVLIGDVRASVWRSAAGCFRFRSLSDPLVFLAAAAEWAIGAAARCSPRCAGGGAGDVIAVTYEYGNTFLIVAGLLNVLVAFDAFDVAQRQSP